MSLSSEVQLRQRAQRLRELTNLTDDATVSINTAVLNAAVADTQATFRTRVGVAFDDTDPEHIAIGCDGVMFFLHRYKGTDTEAVEARWETALANFRKSKRSGLMAPATNSPYEPTLPPAGSLPPDDIRYYDDLIPDPPGGGPAADYRGL